MPGLLPDIDPDGLLEYSVVYTDRSLNHMSCAFQQVMTDIARDLRHAYNAHAVAIVPGGGTFAMEAVARQFAADRHALIVRNGFFSYRWTQILDAGSIAATSTVLSARALHAGSQAPFAPAPLEQIVATIRSERPGIVFAPHVETASGMILPQEWIAAIAEATHAVGSLFVLDCIASGAIWVDMRASGVDVLISAPQKGWSATPCAGLVMLGEEARRRIDETTSSSFAADLKRWLGIMESYEKGGHAYHATMPTDGLRMLRAAITETVDFGLDAAQAAQQRLGDRVRTLLAARGFPSVAAEGFGAPGVVVCYTSDPEIHNGSRFRQAGLQTAAGVPLQCGEPADFRSFRIGLFGLDKLKDVERTVATLERALDTL
ncbi:MAG: alanine--glyoxylate aminotransferase family protein [Pseudomonadales bacterium]|jgi:aspartate aminotransferase-like enzyme|nr:alanine--glyoxylate aminotransferase family protein [Pseudomonadales bacterium]